MLPFYSRNGSGSDTDGWAAYSVGTDRTEALDTRVDRSTATVHSVVPDPLVPSSN